MKLISFDAESLPRRSGGSRSTVARITFFKSGSITFNQVASGLIGLQTGDRISLVQDKDDPVNWYFCKDPKKGFVVRLSSDKRYYVFNHAELVRTFIEALELDRSVNHKFLLAGQPTLIKGDKTQYWGILITQ